MLRLTKRPQFQLALAGKTLAKTPHFAWHCGAIDALASEPAARSSDLLFPTQAIWLGAMVPKRWAKRAVTRNAIRRQIYSVAAEYAGGLVRAAHVVRLRAGYDAQQFPSAVSTPLKLAVRDELHALFGAVCSRSVRPAP